MARREKDFYPTPARLVDALRQRVEIGGVVYEPCAGDLAIANCFPGCLTNDVDITRPTMLHVDATRPEAWAGIECAWVVTNPPFNQAAAILPLAYECATVGVAFLLRLTFLEPTEKRGEWLQAHRQELAHLIIFGQSRPSFTGKGTDSATVAWMVWKKQRPWGTLTDFVVGWDGRAALNNPA
jgi:hypothetical protein